MLEHTEEGEETDKTEWKIRQNPGDVELFKRGLIVWILFCVQCLWKILSRILIINPTSQWHTNREFNFFLNEMSAEVLYDPVICLYLGIQVKWKLQSGRDSHGKGGRKKKGKGKKREERKEHLEYHVMAEILRLLRHGICHFCSPFCQSKSQYSRCCGRT